MHSGLGIEQFAGAVNQGGKQQRQKKKKKKRQTLALRDFNDSVTFDDGLPIGTTEVQEIVDLSEPMNSNFDAEIDCETLSIALTFPNVLHCLWKL
ncbi:hypothetical protein TNCV_5019181 [Trichonephila clavipes]|nr:hypothetical protein TNCV_5019181 [Trichonephila clavipes]